MLGDKPFLKDYGEPSGLEKRTAEKSCLTTAREPVQKTERDHRPQKRKPSGKGGKTQKLHQVCSDFGGEGGLGEKNPCKNNRQQWKTKQENGGDDRFLVNWVYVR